MIVLHAGWLRATDREPAALVIWAEALVVRRRAIDRVAAPASPAPHPFAVPVAGLRQALATPETALSGHATTVVARLPSRGGLPLPSRPWLWQVEDDGPATLAAWSVPALRLTPLDVLTFLARFPVDDIRSEFEPGDDLVVWREVAGLALALLAGQHVRPTLVGPGGDGASDDLSLAVWQPLLTGDGVGRQIAQLAQAMPPVARAVGRQPEDEPLAPGTLVRGFLDEAIDAFARTHAVARRAKLPAAPAPPDQWLAALTRADRRAALPQSFVGAYQRWVDTASLALGGTFRVCFRLEPPEEDEERWALRYFLQATDDPSLLVPAAAVWSERGEHLSLLYRTFDQPQERLLVALGLAARLSPPVEESLDVACPEVAWLSPEDAYQFLRETSVLLQASGYGILLPDLGAQLRARVRLSPHRQASGADGGVSRFGWEQVLDFDWELALGDQPLEREELEALAALKQPLVRIRGQWVELKEEQRAQLLSLLGQNGEGRTLTLSEALRLSLAPENMAGVPIDDVRAEGWFGEMLDRLRHDGAASALPLPADFHGELRPYQRSGVSWMAFLHQYGLGACLADDMGLGKCCTGDTRLAVNGETLRADRLWDRFATEPMFDGEGWWAEPSEPLLVNALDEATGRIVQQPIRMLYRQRVRETLRRVVLEDGSAVTITGRHKLLTPDGWATSFGVGDYICVPAQLHWDGEPQDPDLLTFVAWQIAEGYELSDPARLTITQKDVRVLEALRESLERISRRYGVKVNHPTIRCDKSALIIHSRTLQRFLEQRGYAWGKRSAEKVIPPFVMQADRDGLRIFLRNYFDAEGSVSVGMRTVEISSASEVLIHQLAVLLRRFGIWLRVAHKQKRATNGSGIYRTYYTGTLGVAAERTFLREIGFGNAAKQERLTRVCAVEGNTNVEGIPAAGIVARVVQQTRLPVRHLGMHNTVYLDGSQQFSRQSLTAVATAMERVLSGEAERCYRKQPRSRWTDQTLESYARLDPEVVREGSRQIGQLLDRDVFYCRVKSIEPVEYDGWVYDVEVPGHHNYVANNVLCHNTVQTIALLLHEDMAGARKPALLVCPTSVVSNWQRELARFAPSLRVMVHHGGRRAKDDFAEQGGRHDLVITSYALLAREERRLAEVEWGVMIVDEAQNIKNPGTKQAQAARRLKADHRLALTGTPVENRLSELWSLMEFLNPGYLGSQSEFRDRFARPIERLQDAEATRQLKALAGPFILRRVKTDPNVIDDLPAKNEMKVFCSLTREQVTLYEAVVKESLAAIEESEGIERRGLILATLMKLKQVCNHPAQFLGDGSASAERSGKLTRLTEMLDEVRLSRDRALVFTQFTEMGKLLQSHLERELGEEVLFFHGAMARSARDRMLDRFQHDPHGPSTLILSLKAGGTGLNLTRASQVFHFDRWWNPAVEDQATDRAFRIGQTRNVQVYKFVCAGTLEEQIDAMIEQKRALADAIVGSSENWITGLSTEQLRDLFRLRKEALA